MTSSKKPSPARKTRRFHRLALSDSMRGGYLASWRTQARCSVEGQWCCQSTESFNERCLGMNTKSLQFFNAHADEANQFAMGIFPLV
jgi:hypothetical protein